MKEFLKKNFAVLLAFLLPMLLIAVVATISYLPSLFISSNYNFLYATCNESIYYTDGCVNYLKQRFTVSNKTLIVNEALQQTYTAHVFLHDTKKNESREITLEEAKILKLSELFTSPEGINITSSYDSNDGFFLFFDNNSSYNYYLIKGKGRSKLNLINNNNQGYYRYRGNFSFIGWILP